LEKVSETAAQAPLTATTPYPVPKSGTTAPRLKGKARKAAKQTSAPDPTPTEPSLGTKNVSSVKYKVPTSVLLEQIDAVASFNGFTSIPSGIRNILQKAIGARERCATWYEAAKKDAFNLEREGTAASLVSCNLHYPNSIPQQ
jgi:hypothetical protein